MVTKKPPDISLAEYISDMPNVKSLICIHVYLNGYTGDEVPIVIQSFEEYEATMLLLTPTQSTLTLAFVMEDNPTVFILNSRAECRHYFLSQLKRNVLCP